jgi:hypothetical protein
MFGMLTRYGWTNVVVALSLAVVPFLMLAPGKHSDRMARTNPAVMASAELNQQ